MRFHTPTIPLLPRLGHPILHGTIPCAIVTLEHHHSAWHFMDASAPAYADVVVVVGAEREAVSRVEEVKGGEGAGAGGVGVVEVGDDSVGFDFVFGVAGGDVVRAGSGSGLRGESRVR